MLSLWVLAVVLHHSEQKEFVSGAFPPFMWLGLVSIDCSTVRNFISEKHKTVATRILGAPQPKPSLSARSSWSL